MNIYEFVCGLLGDIPLELEFLKAIGVIVVLVAIIWVVIYPFIFVYNVLLKKW